MKQLFTPRFARAVAPLLCATALVSIPAVAQDATPQTTPPVVVTPPNTATVTIPPVVPTVSNPDASGVAEPAAAPAPRTTPRSTATRTATRAQATRSAPRTAPAPRAAAPAPSAPAPVAAPPAAAPEAVAPPAAPIAAPAAVPAVPAPQAADTTTRSIASTSAVPVWAWVAGGLAILAIVLIGAFALRRRRTDDYAYDEPAYIDEPYVEPVAAAPVASPLAAAAVEPRPEPGYLRRTEPVADVEPAVAAPEDIEVASASADDVAELTAAAAPVAERPWLEFAMRPVRAGTNVDEALVEIELTVGNSGSVAAEDVRISTFLLSGDADGSEMERLLVDPPTEATTDPVTIQPGEGKRIDATLALLKSDMGEDLPSSFRPIVVADARYTLADGSEGRTSASFTVGVTPEEGEGLEPIELARASMHDNVAAELHGEPVRA